jgi:hypothetical protein
MISKLKAILGSVRFWIAIIGTVIFYLGSAGIISKELADAILSLLGVSIVVRTVDKFSK